MTNPHPPAADARAVLPLLRRLYALYRPERARLLGGLGLSLLATLSGIGLLAVSGHFIASMALVGAGGVAIDYYTPAALVRLFAILRTGGRYAERLVTHDATLAVLARLRDWLFARLVPLAPARLGAARGAELLSRLRADVDTLEHAYLGLLLPTATAALSALVVILIAAAWAWPVAIMLAVLLALAGVGVPWWLQRRGAIPAAASDRDGETLRTQLADALAGRAELALFGADLAFEARIDATLAQRQQAQRRCQQLQARGEALVATLVPLAVALALALGLPRLHAGALTGPGLALLALLAMAAFDPVLPLPASWARWGAIRAAAERVFELADRVPAVADPTSPQPPPDACDLQLRHVWMRHAEDADGWALDGLDLDLPAGARLALVGQSGAGKSSVARVLGRLYPYQGSIRLGGVPLDALDADAVRARIAIVEQDPYLFDASLRDNLRLARPDADDARQRAALATAQLGAFLDALPEGLDTWIGANGASVSGGEARRIAIARALLAEAPILVLDEPSEGLDAATAAALYTALAEATRGRSLLLITHRLGALSTLVDEVATMEAGRIVARGPIAATVGIAASVHEDRHGQAG